MKRIFTLILFFTQIVFAKAQWTSDTTVNTIVRDTLGASSPMIASDQNGNSYISWFESNAGNLNLHMQLLDSNGYSMWGPGGELISSHPQNSALFGYDLKTDNDGNAIVVISDERTGSLNVVVYKIDNNGLLLWGADGIVLIDSLATSGLAPTIGITSSNDVVIAWTADGVSGKWISAERISSSGILQWNSNYRIIDTTWTLAYSRPKLFPSGSDDIQMLYVEESGTFPGVTSTMYTQRIHPAGNNFWPAPIQVSSKTIPFFYFPEPVTDDNGGFYVAFNTSNPTIPSLNDVYVQYVDYNGSLWNATGNEAANSTTGHKLSASSMYVSHLSEYWVLLQKLDGGQGSSGVSLQKFDGQGNVLFGPDGLDIIVVDPVYYAPATLDYAGDGMIISYKYGLQFQEKINALKVDDAGNLLWSGLPVSLCAVSGGKDDLQSGDFLFNNLVYVWQDDRNGSGVFAQNITGEGWLGIVSGVGEQFAYHQIRVYPNPSSEPVLYFDEDRAEKKLIAIRDIDGRKIFEAILTGNEKEFSLADLKWLERGLYFISINQDDFHSVIKWMKW